MHHIGRLLQQLLVHVIIQIANHNTKHCDSYNSLSHILIKASESIFQIHLQCHDVYNCRTFDMECGNALGKWLFTGRLHRVLLQIY